MQVLIITACKSHVTHEKKNLCGFQKYQKKHYSKIKDLGISNDSI